MQEVKKCNLFKFNYGITTTLLPLYDTHHRVLINRGKFDACISIGFRGVKTDRQKSALYIKYNSVTRRVPISNVKIENVGSAGRAGFTNQLLCEELPKAYVFSAHKIFTTFCASFRSSKNFSFQNPGYGLGLCALFFADTNPKKLCVSRSLKYGTHFSY